MRRGEEGKLIKEGQIVNGGLGWPAGQPGTEVPAKGCGHETRLRGLGVVVGWWLSKMAPTSTTNPTRGGGFRGRSP